MSVETAITISEAEYELELKEKYREMPIEHIFGTFWQIHEFHPTQLNQKQSVRERVLFELIQEAYEQNQSKLYELRKNLENRLSMSTDFKKKETLKREIHWLEHYLRCQESLPGKGRIKLSSVYHSEEMTYSLLGDFLVYTMKWAGVVFYEDSARLDIRLNVNSARKRIGSNASAEKIRNVCLRVINKYAHNYSLGRTVTQLEDDFKKYATQNTLKIEAPK